MKRILWGTLAATALASAVAYTFRAEITLRLVEKAVASNFRTNLLRELPDGLHVALCGAGSPLPDPERSGPCTAVIAGGRLYVVDAGAGASRVLSRMRIPQGEIVGILLTHFHSDHIDGLGELLLQRWVGGSATSPLPVYGPSGVERIVEGYGIAYAPDRQYRVAHHGAEVVPPSGAGGVARPFPVPEEGAANVIVDDGELTIIAFRVSHSPVEPAVGYRFDYRGRSVLISGDTTESVNLEKFAEGVDLLVHEALAPHLVELITQGARAAGRDKLAKITEDILDYHTTPVEAAKVARAAGAGYLLFNHIVPPLPLAPMEEVFLQGVDDAYSGPVRVGRDGTLVQLDTGTTSIEVSELL